MTLIVASQLGEQIDARLNALVDGIRIIPLPAGLPDALPAEARVLIHVPGPEDGASRSRNGPPPDWPGSLELVQLITTGIDSYPGWLLGRVPTCNCAGPAGSTLAEFALAAIFDHAKDIPSARIMSPDQWHRRPVAEVRGTVLGIYGFGHVGLALATAGLALGMRVRAVRRSTAPFPVAGVERAADLADLLATCDHVVLAAPATPETRHVVNADTLAGARVGLHLINVARGSLIDDDALIGALADGRLSRATLDTTDPEPLPSGHPYYDDPHVVLTPHIANAVPGFFDRVIERCAVNLKRLREGGPLEGLIDPQKGY